MNDDDRTEKAQRMLMESPPKCPYCNGEREWAGTGLVANCYFCGRASIVEVLDD